MPDRDQTIDWATLKHSAGTIMLAGAVLTAQADPAQMTVPRKVVAGSLEFILNTPDDHVGAVLAVMHHGAARKPDADIDIRFYESPAKLIFMRIDSNPEHEDVKSVLDTTDVLNRSTAFPVQLQAETANMLSNTNMQSFDSYWDQTKTIIVQSVGNDGYNPNNHTKDPIPLIRNGKWLEVGEAATKGSKEKVENWSSPADPSFVVTNPYKAENLKYKSYETAPEIIKQAYLKYDGLLPYELRECADATKTNIDLYGDLEGSNLQEVGKCINKAIGAVADKNGYPLQPPVGTSFSSPNAAIMIAGAMSRYPGLTPDDYVAAALLADKPLHDGRSRTYIPNGSGVVLYDTTGKSGLGLLTEGNLDKTVKGLSDLQKANPDQKTTPARVSSGTVDFTTPDSNTYILPVTSDVTNIRTMVEMRLKGNFNPADPPQIFLTSPQGVCIPAVTTIAVGENPTVHISTNAFFGTAAKGDWTLISSAEIQSANVTVYGVERNGLLDRYIEQTKTASANPLETYKSLQKRPEAPVRTNGFTTLRP